MAVVITTNESLHPKVNTYLHSVHLVKNENIYMNIYNALLSSEIRLGFFFSVAIESYCKYYVGCTCKCKIQDT